MALVLGPDGHVLLNGLPPELLSPLAYLEAYAGGAVPSRGGGTDDALRSTLLLSASAAHLLQRGDRAGLARMAGGLSRAIEVVRAGAARPPRFDDARALAAALLDLPDPVRHAPSRLAGTDPLVPGPAALRGAIVRLAACLDAVAAAPNLVRAACEAHLLFEEVHPFADANGRTGRLVLAWQLLAAGRPAPRFRLADREPYLAAVRTRDAAALETIVRAP